MLCVGQKGQLQPLFSGQVPRTTLIKAETADFTGLKVPLMRCMCVQYNWAGSLDMAENEAGVYVLIEQLAYNW